MGNEKHPEKRSLRIHALTTVQFSYAPGDQGFGLKRRLGMPFGTLEDGM